MDAGHEDTRQRGTAIMCFWVLSDRQCTVVLERQNIQSLLLLYYVFLEVYGAYFY